MHCPNCSTELSKEANFCFRCGFDMKKEKPSEPKKPKTSPKVTYNGYLSVGGWLFIIAGAIVAIIIIRNANSGFRELDSGILLTGLAVLFSTVIYAWLYFGLHKTILKISRIEQALGIDNEEVVIRKQDQIIESSNPPKNSTK